jgi:hypothetical protein
MHAVYRSIVETHFIKGRYDEDEKIFYAAASPGNKRRRL